MWKLVISLLMVSPLVFVSFKEAYLVISSSRLTITIVFKRLFRASLLSLQMVFKLKLYLTIEANINVDNFTISIFKQIILLTNGLNYSQNICINSHWLHSKAVFSSLKPTLFPLLSTALRILPKLFLFWTPRNFMSYEIWKKTRFLSIFWIFLERYSFLMNNLRRGSSLNVFLNVCTWALSILIDALPWKA